MLQLASLTLTNHKPEREKNWRILQFSRENSRQEVSRGKTIPILKSFSGIFLPDGVSREACREISFRSCLKLEYFRHKFFYSYLQVKRIFTHKRSSYE